eukprot:TRINITY_DN18958_c0_g3_i2.p2 TRINITY_DN18958_c0_g3~~TRINITY_DN18958_c0_g3_i2.p2  ORF type:complete len:216 (+),score=29.55 TRINITY_DN18958_c0_g3_i2:92-649(+)
MAEDAQNGRETKRVKKDFEGYLLNISQAVVKEHESKSFGEILEAPVSALEGVGSKGEEVFNSVGVKTVRDLAEWKFFRIARALLILKDLSGDERVSNSLMNIDKAVVKEYEQKSLKEICAASVDALEGLTKEHAEKLGTLSVSSVESLGDLKYCSWAAAILELSQYETMDVVEKGNPSGNENGTT